MSVKEPAHKGGYGASVKRKEDPRFIRGKGNYVDDVNSAGDGLPRHRPQPIRAREDQQHRRVEGARDGGRPGCHHRC